VPKIVTSLGEVTTSNPHFLKGQRWSILVKDDLLPFFCILFALGHLPFNHTPERERDFFCARERERDVCESEVSKWENAPCIDMQNVEVE